MVDRDLDAPWLDPDERSTWLALSALLMKFPAALDAQLQRDAGLSFFEYMVLAVLSERPERRGRMTELAGLANGSLSRLSHVARRLEGRGLISRRPSPEDRRATEARLTEAGWEVVVDAAPTHVATVRRLVFDTLPDERHRQVREACVAILSGVDPCTLDVLAALSPSLDRAVGELRERTAGVPARDETDSVDG